MAWIVIDGYNFIRRPGAAVASEKGDDDLGRGALISRLAVYRQAKGHRITVVFDGTYSENRIDETDQIQGIEIVYTRFGRTADDWMLELMRNTGDDLIAVSSDNEILRAAKACEKGYLKVEEFDRKLNESMYGTLDQRDEEERVGHKRWMTKKKGPAKRLPKGKRKALSRLD